MTATKFEIRNRWNGNVQVTAEIVADDATSLGVKIGLAVRWAYRFKANLRGADLAGANLRGADLGGADLAGANLAGANLRGADLAGANLRDADLGGADLRGADLGGANLRGADLRDADLRDADLRDADLRDADLAGANLAGANLRGADLGGAPRIENIHQAVYAAASAPGALAMGNWHTCETTHCRAGWVIWLAGGAGKELEKKLGTPTAATLIYVASDPMLEKVPDFYCPNDAALADMKRLAGLEAAPVSA